MLARIMTAPSPKTEAGTARLVVSPDARKAHTLSKSNLAYDGRPLGAGLIRIVCSCGFVVSASERRARQVVKEHLAKAFTEAAGASS